MHIVMLAWLKCLFKNGQVHEETFGKTGCRRIVPGQYLAVDPNGRAVLIGAVEKQKFVYILTRDSKANLVCTCASSSSSIGADCRNRLFPLHWRRTSPIRFFSTLSALTLGLKTRCLRV